MAQLVSGLLSEQEVHGLILFNICFDFPLIHKTGNGGRGVKGALSASIDTSLVTKGTTNVK